MGQTITRQVNRNLLKASENGDLEKAKRAIENHANMNVKDCCKNGCTPFHLASKHGHEAIVHLLMAHGACFYAEDANGSTPLHFASKYGHEAIVSLLVNNGAEISVENNYGDTPLHFASMEGHENIVSLLLENGANVHAKNKYDKTSLQLAQEYNNGNSVVAIEEFLQFQKECLEKFKTRAALEQEMQRLEGLFLAAKDSFDDPVANSKREVEIVEYDKLLPLFKWPQYTYMPVTAVEKEIESLKMQVKSMSFGPEKTRKVHELYDLTMDHYASSDVLEMKLAVLEKKREYFISRAEFAKKFGRDVEPIIFHATGGIDIKIGNTKATLLEIRRDQVHQLT